MNSIWPFEYLKLNVESGIQDDITNIINCHSMIQHVFKSFEIYSHFSHIQALLDCYFKA